MDDVSVLDSQDSGFESNSDSDMESEEVESENMEDLEEGELRQGMEYVEQSNDVDRRNVRPEDIPVVGDQTVGNQESLEAQGTGGVNANVVFHDVHGKEMGAAHVQINDESHTSESDQSNKKDCGGPSEIKSGIQNNGPVVDEGDMQSNGSNDGPDELGPMSAVNLGKRNRGERSPPSIGSTQGPSQRMFNHSGMNDREPLDLNTPVRESSGINSAIPPIPKVGSGTSKEQSGSMETEGTILGDGAEGWGSHWRGP
ncbi:hypothetical protein Hanom_Chr17g01527281 [Helianthus anomalus]